MPRLGVLALVLYLTAQPLPGAAGEAKEPVYQGKPLSAWVEQLADRSAMARQEAANAALAKMGPAAKPALGALVAALGDTDDAVRRRRRGAFLFGKGAVGPLTAALERPDPAVPPGAAAAFFHMGPDAREAVALIAVLKNDADPDVRQTAADALGGIGPAAGEAVEPLAAVAVGKDAALHGPAVIALGGVGKASVPAWCGC